MKMDLEEKIFVVGGTALTAAVALTSGCNRLDEANYARLVSIPKDQRSSIVESLKQGKTLGKMSYLGDGDKGWKSDKPKEPGEHGYSIMAEFEEAGHSFVVEADPWLETNFLNILVDNDYKIRSVYYAREQPHIGEYWRILGGDDAPNRKVMAVGLPGGVTCIRFESGGKDGYVDSDEERNYIASVLGIVGEKLETGTISRERILAYKVAKARLDRYAKKDLDNAKKDVDKYMAENPDLVCD